MQRIAPSKRDTGTAPRASANPQPRSHVAGLLRSERQLLANGRIFSNQSGDCNVRSARREWAADVIYKSYLENFRINPHDALNG